MNILKSMVDSQIILFIYAVFGMLLGKKGIINTKSRRSLVLILMDLAVPMMVLDAFNRHYSREDFSSSLLVIVLSAGFSIFSFLLGIILFSREEEGRKSVLKYAIMYSNAGMIGLPVVALVFGDKGVFYASMYMVPLRVLQWTLGLSLFTKNSGKKQSFVKNVLLNPVVVVVYIGLLQMALGFVFPQAVGLAIKGLGNTAAPLSMLLLGATLREMNIKMFVDFKVMLLSLFRLILIPLASIAFTRLLGLDFLASAVCVTLLAMPVANNTAGIAERYGGDYVFASACVCVSTVFSLFTVPFIAYILQNL